MLLANSKLAQFRLVFTQKRTELCRWIIIFHWMNQFANSIKLSNLAFSELSEVFSSEHNELCPYIMDTPI
jgi:hypothetical protein